MRQKTSEKCMENLGVGLLAVLLCAIGAAANPLVSFESGKNIKDLKGASILSPQSKVTSFSLTLTPAEIKGPSNGGATMLDFTTMVYRNSIDNEVHLFGPTLRLAAGDYIQVELSNNLTYPATPAPNQLPASVAIFAQPFQTNLHTHGVHASPGVFSQGSRRYEGGDNIFSVLEAKPANATDLPKELYDSALPDDHMPGLHWYHPHAHGSSGLQSATANGLILVEDDPAWLPDSAGCGGLRAALDAAPDVVLHLSFFLFGPVQTAFPGADAPLDDTDVQAWSELSDPSNPLCCGNATDGPQLQLSGVNDSSNFVLVNGGFQPEISLAAGQFQRWRLAHVGFKTYVDLQILDPSTMLPAPCELRLVAKDGVYLMQAPRAVDHIFLATANRAELLVRCTPPGGGNATYILSAGGAPSPFGNYSATGAGASSELVQTIVATVAVAAAAEGEAPSAALVEDACTPLRPDYASDLRDDSLAAHNANDKLVTRNYTFTFGNQTYGCLVNDKNFSYPDAQPINHPLGSVVEWPDFQYASEHPLHIHTNPFQLITLSDTFLPPGVNYSSWFREGDWHDTVMLPFTAADADQLGPSINIRIQPGEFTGYSVMHCHSLHHEDEGCMKVIEWSCPGYNSTGGVPTSCPGYAPPVPGTFVKGSEAPAAAPAAAPSASGAAANAAVSSTLLAAAAAVLLWTPQGCSAVVHPSGRPRFP